MTTEKLVIIEELFRLYVYLSVIHIHMRALDQASAYTHMRKHTRIRTWDAKTPFLMYALDKMKNKNLLK